METEATVGGVRSLTVMVTTELVTLNAPGARTMARYCAPLSLPKRMPVTKLLWVRPDVARLVQPPAPLLRCQTKAISPAVAGTTTLLVVKVTWSPVKFVELPATLVWLTGWVTMVRSALA